MDKIGVVILAALGGLLVIALAAVLGGTLVYWLWPHVIPVVFPGPVEAGALAGSLLWWKAVMFTWVCGILFKGSGGVNTSK